MFTTLQSQIVELTHTLPISWFAFAASFVEEVIVPIPSPFVMLTAGSLARLQSVSLIEIGLIVLIAALGKTLGACLVYWIADKAEDIVLGRYAHFFGVTRADTERLGRRFSGTSRDYVLMTFLRALPIMPSALISIGSGVLRLPLRLFIVATFLGTVIRDGIYFYAGYAGTQALHSIIATLKHVEDLILLVSVVAVAGVALMLWFLRRRKHTKEESL